MSTPEEETPEAEKPKEEGTGSGSASDSKGDEARYGMPPPAEPVTLGDTTYKPLADGRYDAIVLGTGLVECVVSGLLSKAGKKVLHLDRNGYYGGESASLNLSNLYRKFINPAGGKEDEPPADFFDRLGQNRDYNVDLIPKFIMADGTLVKILIYTGVNNYLDFKQVGGSFVWKKGGEVHKVPATEKEAVTTSLMGFFQKRKFRSFLQFVAKADPENPETWDGFDLRTKTMADLYDKFGLDENTQDFTGHAMAMHTEDGYLTKPALETVANIRLYAHSLDRYGGSPFIYPIYGLGGLPEGFSRLCAINGGTFILNKPVDEIMFNDKGVAVGVRSGEGDDAEVAVAPVIVGDPSYFPAKQIRKTGQVIRSVCIFDHPVAKISDMHSAQIIIPQKQVGRHNDIYLNMLSNAHCVSAKGKFVAIASTTVEDGAPAAGQLGAAIALLGGLTVKFDSVLDTFEPVADGTEDHCYISKSYDATSHFESVSADALDLYRRITGETLDLTPATGAGAEGK